MPRLRQMQRRSAIVDVLLLLLLLYLLPILPNICLQHSFAAATDTDRVADKWNSQSKVDSYASRLEGDFFPTLNEFSRHSVIRPQIYHGRHKTAIASTLDAEDGLHVPQIMLSYYHQGWRIEVDLQRNDQLLPDTHFLRIQDSRSAQGFRVKNFTKTEAALCHYQGVIRGNPLSSVAVSTCNGGVNGIVFDGNDTYFIHSGSDGRLRDDHFLFRHADLLAKNATCGYEQTSANDGKPGRGHDGSEFNRILRYKRSSGDDNAIRGPFNANPYSSYVELVIVVDNGVYKSFGENTKKVHQHCKDLANIINALYVPLNIFVALVGVVIWNESNEIDFSDDGDATLRNFLNYRRTKLSLEHPNDNAQLLTKKQFNGGVVGKALKGPICTHEYSGGVSMEHSEIIAVVATTMAHEMGHNFGMEHDSPDCKCPDEKCIMSASSTSEVPVHWSSCSKDQLTIAFTRGMNYCLRNKPTKLFDSPQCGNGFVEPGEQCDCGLPQHCENTCCDPYTCMLYANASCATGECCDLNTCRPKVAGTTCRAASNECDLPEYCTGESEYCPMDVFKRDTESCDNGQAYCFQGDCRSHTNQCRILWGPTGESSEHCYDKNTEGKRGGNCGYNRLNNTFIPCARENIACGMLHCRHLNERLEFGLESAAVLSHSFINHGGKIVPCRTALVDLGLQSTDPGLTPNGAKCGDDRMCVNQKCLAVAELHARGLGAACPDDCNGNGVCNSRGHCHCDIGYSGASCLSPGPGGSINSGPATNPNSHDTFQRFMYIFFFLVIPLMAAFCYLMYYCRNRPFFIGGKLAENIIKSASGTKQPTARAHHPPPPPPGSMTLPKSTPSSTDDMNSALLKSPSESGDALNGSMFGKFKGFTLRPLNDATSPSGNLSGPNVAYVQPTVQDTTLTNGGVPLRAAPPPPGAPKSTDGLKPNGTLSRKAPPPPSTTTAATAPALPPPNPGSNARPIISMPVLETSTLTLARDTSPIRPAPPAPAGGTLKSAPPPPIPLHADPKLNVKRDGTIRRIASFLKKEEKPPLKEKTYIDREKLRNLEISAPIPVAGPQGESSNSDSESTPKEEETKNLVKRTQSMRSPTKKPSVQTFGSMRQPPGAGRPKSVLATTASRPKSPPPRPPPLKKTNSTTSSGYQMPVATARSTAENTYDDCEFIETPLASVAESQSAQVSPTTSDNIYSVIDEIPPAARTLKRSDLVSMASTGSGDMGLLGEIVNEIEKRNGGGGSLYSSSGSGTGSATSSGPASSKANKESAEEVTSKSGRTETEPTRPAPPPPASLQAQESTTTPVTDVAKLGTSQTVPTYLRPAPLNTPVARVAPTRSDLAPSTAFSSFKPATGKATPATVSTHQNRFGAESTASSSMGASTTGGKKKPVTATAKAGAAVQGPAPATIQKPKPLSAKPSLNAGQRKPTSAGGVAVVKRAGSGSTAGAVGAPRAPPTVKSTTIASMARRFEKGAGTGSIGSSSNPITETKQK